MSLQELEGARERCRQELSGLSGWALGSLVETEREQGGKRKPFRYLSRSSQGRNRITYISEAQVEPLRQSLEEGRKAKRLLEQIADLTVAILKARTPGKEAGA
jgi:hypothetical protein